MALMRVYCGLAASEPTDAPSGAWLTVAVVDDAGRLLDVCEVGDDPAGYAVLGALLAERSGGAANVAVAADSDDHQITLLLATAGRPLVIADEEIVADYAERFADDDSSDEVEAGDAERGAVGLARALAAGALTAATQPAPREMVALKPVLSAHAAVAVSRNASATALREVLRELYPAALRAYPDPAEPVPLAILDALPEPGMLGTTNSSRGRDAAVTAELAKTGVADTATLAEAITALRVAIAETPRRTGVGKGPTAAVAETIRQAVAAVRAWDAAETALIGLLSTKGAIRREQPVALRAVGSPAPAPAPAVPRGAGTSRRGRVSEVAAPASPPPVRVPEPAPRPVGRPTTRPAAARIPEPRIAEPRTAEPRRAEPIPAAEIRAVEPRYAPDPRYAPEPQYPAQEPQYAQDPRYATDPRYAPEPPRAPEAPYQPAAAAQPYPSHAPVDLPRAGSGGPTQGLTPSWAAEPFTGYPAVTSGAPGGGYGDNGGYPGEPYAPMYRSGGYPTVGGHPQAPVPGHPVEPRYQGDATQQPATGGHPAVRQPPTGGYPAVPKPSTGGYPAVTGNGHPGDAQHGYPSPDYAAPGSRDLWPLVPVEDDGIARVAPGYEQQPREGRVAPPWQTDDLELPAEPAALRTPGAPPALRLVGRDDVMVPSGPSALDMPRVRGPVEDEADGDLLIFAQARSAWFVTQPDIDSELTWSDAADQGWSAAERAAHPQTDGETEMGLPRRVPKANLVPGSPLPPMSESGLRIVRDPAAMAAHTTGYFSGSRRGEEVRGYAVAGRPGRESGGGWDFSRDGWETDSETEYRSAARR